MINVKIIFKNKKISKIEISGHANYSDYGNDIVCAGVSMLSYAIANKIINLGFNSIVIIGDNKFVFENNVVDSNVDLLLTTLYEGLLMVKSEYSDYIKVKEV